MYTISKRGRIVYVLSPLVLCCVACMLSDTRDQYSHSLQNAMLNVYLEWKDGMYESFTTLALWPL